MRLKLIRGVLQSKGTPALLLFLLVFGCSSSRDSINPPPEYQSVVAKLREVVQYEMEDKGFPYLGFQPPPPVQWRGSLHHNRRVSVLNTVP